MPGSRATDSRKDDGPAPENAAQAVRLVIADGQPVLRMGLRRLLEGDPGFEVVGETGSGKEAVEMAQKLAPDLMLLDLDLPKLPGMDALGQITESSPRVRVVLFPAAIDKATTVQALQLGARGILLKDAPPETILKCLRCVMKGEYWVGRDSIYDLLELQRAIAERERAERKMGLTAREMAIIAAVIEGLGNRDIAQKLAISQETVKHHLTSIFNKTGVSNRLELALFAIHHKLRLYQ